MTGEALLAHHDGRGALPMLYRLVAVYLEVYAGAGPFYSEARYREQITGHLTMPGWQLVTATIDDELVGYVYGYPVPATTRSWQGLRTPLPDDVTREDGHRTLSLSN